MKRRNIIHIEVRTEVLEHLVALVQDESLDLVDLELLLCNELLATSGGGHDDMRRIISQQLVVLTDRDTTEEHAHLGNTRRCWTQYIMMTHEQKKAKGCVTQATLTAGRYLEKRINSWQIW
jgi:GTPase involved in cell partitioning and DNA repair